MKTSLKKLRGLALHRHSETRDKRDRHFLRPLAQLDELAQASREIEGMRDCYDCLLSAAAAMANSAFEFSESLRETGTCFLEKTALSDDEESGKVLLMLGKVQFEIQKLVDNYRSHIFRTITIPSESFINELQTVEEMKRHCDEKRAVYEYVSTKHREKGRLRNTKGENFSSQQLQIAHDEYDEEANLFLFRLKSLKEGQFRSLLTQAARHHAAQLCFFRKAFESLEAVETHVKLVTEKQHIDYQFSGLEDNDRDDGENDDDGNDDYSYDAYDDGELSFDYGHDDSTSRNSMEEKLGKNPGRHFLAFGREHERSYQSAPLLSEKKFDPSERFREIQQLSTRKLHMYVLPTPDETKTPISTASDTQVLQTRRASLSGSALKLWHSSPLEQKNYGEIIGDEKVSRDIVLSSESVLRESNNNAISGRLTSPLVDGLFSPHWYQPTISDFKEVDRHAFSGPLPTKSWSNKSDLFSNGPTASKGHSRLASVPFLQTTLPQPSSPSKLFSRDSPELPSLKKSEPLKLLNSSHSLVSSPKTGELHELPRPPSNLTSNFSVRSSNLVIRTSPLAPKDQEHSAKNKYATSMVASPLPAPPQAVPQSFSIPSTGEKMTLLPVSETSEAPTI